MRRLKIAAAVAALFVVGCSESSASDASKGAERVPVTIDAESGAVVYQAELADTDKERARGLMWREQMGESEGMLFLFPKEEQLRFWMKNTLIPLDMIFIRADRTILGVVENAQPKTETLRFIPGPSQFVLEINGGLAKKKGIKAGQKVTFYAPVPSS